MEIFNKQIFGSDADNFLAMSACDKLVWVKKYTNQQDDAQIKEFIKIVTKGKDCKCINCGKDEHISKGNEPKNVDSSEPVLVGKSSKRNGNKRQPNTNSRKDK